MLSSELQVTRYLHLKFRRFCVLLILSKWIKVANIYNADDKIFQGLHFTSKRQRLICLKVSIILSFNLTQYSVDRKSFRFFYHFSFQFLVGFVGNSFLVCAWKNSLFVYD